MFRSLVLCAVMLTSVAVAAPEGAALLLNGAPHLQVRGTAAISGRVADASDRPVAGVRVVARFFGLAEPRATTTLEDGTYRLDGVPPGVYRLSASLTGFKSTIRNHVEVAE